MEKKLTIAIDGHSGCGKSSTAKVVAKKLNLKYLDSGAMYRAVTLSLIQSQIDFEDIDAIKAALNRIEINFITDSKSGENLTVLNGEVVEQQIRTMQITQHVSEVSRIPEVRRRMVHLQQLIGKDGGVVMDGRDIGTVVFPDADLKIFMTADLKTRALRRQEELKAKNQPVELSVIQENLASRDYIDSTRKEGPLKKADDAIVVDTTNLKFDEQVTQIVKLAKEVSTAQTD